MKYLRYLDRKSYLDLSYLVKNLNSKRGNIKYLKPRSTLSYYVAY